MITFTQKAANKLIGIMKEQEVSDTTFLRVGVKGGGCSGFTYTVDFESKQSRFDLMFESNGLHVVVDKKSHLYIKDTEIDWSDNFNDRGLKFDNPSAKGSCGCRTSFMQEGQGQDAGHKPTWM